IAFKLRSDFWGTLADFSVLPALGELIVIPDLEEAYLMVALAPAFLMVQYSHYQATVCEAERLRALRREIPRWNLFTGTAPEGFEASQWASAYCERRPGWRFLLTAGAIAAAVLFYTVVCFGWSCLIIVPVFFWGFMALYQFSFSPDN
ncbi:MAG: hypothetical protein RBU21_12435, partial [FCB group bacterium]|nr:hypothetical protein [FCB group bacterium]